jgi:hypothetical protein
MFGSIVVALMMGLHPCRFTTPSGFVVDTCMSVPVYVTIDTETLRPKDLVAVPAVHVRWSKDVTCNYVTVRLDNGVTGYNGSEIYCEAVKP